jgi:hypothetical protein
MNANCPRCSGFAERRNFSSPREYRDLARQLIEMVSEGTFRIVSQSCLLEDLFKSPLPGDTVQHDFACTLCDRRFHLSADTYHGNGGWDFD